MNDDEIRSVHPEKHAVNQYAKVVYGFHTTLEKAYADLAKCETWQTFDNLVARIRQLAKDMEGASIEADRKCVELVADRKPAASQLHGE